MDPDHLRSVARGYPALGGVRIAPLGLGFVSQALFAMGWGPFARFDVAFVVSLAALGGLFWVNRWYDDRYGRVTPDFRKGPRIAAFLLATAAYTVLGGWSRWSLHLPVNGFSLAFGLAYLGVYATGTARRPHHLAISGSLVLVSVLPVWHGDARTAGLLLAGIAMILNGVLDHLALLRLFDPPCAESECARG